MAEDDVHDLSARTIQPITPGRPFLRQPSGEPCGRIAQSIGETERFGLLNMHVAALRSSPLITLGKIGPLVRCRYRLARQRQPERIRANMNAPHSLRMSHAQPGRHPRADTTAARTKSLLA